MFTGYLGDLVQNLKKLPGIGKKSAQRLAMHIVGMDKAEAVQLAESVKMTIDNYRNCSVCNMLTESDPCSLCIDPLRDDKVLCVVENTQDVFLIEETREFKGKYFVMNKLLSPLDGIGPEEIQFPRLYNLVKQKKIKELILALNPSAEGETTMNFLASELHELVEKITRLSTGLPFGGDIGYTSSLTLGNALKRRYSIEE